MTIEDQIRDEKLQYDINREAAKISALSSGKIDTYEYLTGEEILPSNEQQMIQQAKFTYSPLGKAFEKQTKTIEDQEKKQIDALESFKSLKPKEVKPIEYDNNFFSGLAKIQGSIEPIDFNDLTYYLKGRDYAPIKVQICFNKFKDPNGVAFKNCAPFTDCISEINNTQAYNAKDIDIVMPMYNLPMPMYNLYNV